MFYFEPSYYGCEIDYSSDSFRRAEFAEMAERLASIKGWLIVAHAKEVKMRQKSGQQKSSADKAIKDIRCATRKSYSAEEKIRVVLEGLRGEDSIAALCRREGIAEDLAG
nr:transposase [Marinicella sp. W31]MDC2877695.1 transposase [Marinicella sp. W31]